MSNNNNLTAYDPDAPFWKAYKMYRDMGWTQTIPCIGKKAAVRGHHGGRKTRVSSIDFERWMRAPYLAHANIALVLPVLGHDECVIAIDLDDGSKHKAKGDGVETLDMLEDQIGFLPETWTNGHGHGPYRHLLFRAKFERYSAPGPGIDLITPWNRYLVVSPSVHPDTGEPYEWRDPDGIACPPPEPGDLPYLPDEWERYLTRGKKHPLNTAHASVDPTSWEGIITVGQAPCKKMVRLADEWVHNPCMKCSSRHDGWLSLCRRALILQAWGHTGADTMLRRLAPAFADLISDRASHDEAIREAVSMYQWALTVVTPPPTPRADPCDLFADMLPAPESFRKNRQ